jgi:hypothetical protein
MDDLDPKFDAEADYRYALWALMSGADWRVIPGSGAPIVDLAASPHWQEPNAMRRVMRGEPSGGHEILGRVGATSRGRAAAVSHHAHKHGIRKPAAGTVGLPCPVSLETPPRSGATLSQVGRGGGGGGHHGGGGHGGHARAPHFPGLHMGPALPPGAPHAPAPLPPHAPAAPHAPAGPHWHHHHGGHGWGWGWGGWGPWGWVAWNECPLGWGWQEQEDGSYLCVELAPIAGGLSGIYGAAQDVLAAAQNQPIVGANWPGPDYDIGRDSPGFEGMNLPPAERARFFDALIPEHAGAFVGAPHGGGGHMPHGHPHHHGGRGFGGREWWDGEPVVLVPCPDGTVMLPDGTCVDVRELVGMGAAAVVGQASAPSSPSADSGVGPSVPNWGFPPASSSSMPAAGVTAPASSGNPDVDALAAQYAAIGQVIAQNAATAPADMQPAWARDDGQWNAWLTDYDNANSVSRAARRASLSAWQSIANDWTQAVKAQWPSSAAAQALTGGQASPIGVYPSQPVTPGGGLNIPGLPSLSTVSWVVVAVLVGIGVWMLWPIIAGGHAAAASVAGPRERESNMLPPGYVEDIFGRVSWWGGGPG